MNDNFYIGEFYTAKLQREIDELKKQIPVWHDAKEAPEEGVYWAQPTDLDGRYEKCFYDDKYGWRYNFNGSMIYCNVIRYCELPQPPESECE